MAHTTLRNSRRGFRAGNLRDGGPVRRDALLVIHMPASGPAGKAGAADLAFSDSVIHSTFLLSNAAPQRQSVNAGRWRQVEATVRELARHADRVVVFTGVLFEGEERTIGAGRVSVPSHTYKVILVERGPARKGYAIIVPNQDHVPETVDQFVVSVDKVEQRTGLDFFGELPDEEEHVLEASRELLTGSPANRE